MRWLVDVEIQSVYAEVLVELVFHFVLPLTSHSRWTHDEHPPRLSPPLHCRQEQTDFNGFPQADVIGDEPIPSVRIHYAMHQIDLVWQGIDVKAIQCSRNLIPGLEREGQHLQSKTLGIVRFPLL